MQRDKGLVLHLRSINLTLHFLISCITFRQSKLPGWDFLSGLVVKNMPSNAGDTGSTLHLQRSHMLWSPQAPTSKAHNPRAHALQQEKPLQQEAHSLQPENGLCLPHKKKSPHTTASTQSS